MALPASGNSLSLNQMHIEVGGTSGTTCSLNDSDIRGLISKSSGATMAFNEWFGASASVADYSTTLTSGHTSLTTTIGYSSYVNAAKGFLTTSASQPMFGTSTNNIGSLSSTSNTNYFGGNTIHGLAMLGTTTSTTGGIHLYVATLNISNSDTSFKEVVINGTTYTRSNATYSSSTYGGFAYSSWSWSPVQANLSNSSATIGNTASAAMGPFPGSGSTCTITFKRN
tara:strand:- start:1304 stop:1981 length:678 start_codon:yes stop_codon:yes gene_type:complete